MLFVLSIIIGIIQNIIFLFAIKNVSNEKFQKYKQPLKILTTSITLYDLFFLYNKLLMEFLITYDLVYLVSFKGLCQSFLYITNYLKILNELNLIGSCFIIYNVIGLLNEDSKDDTIVQEQICKQDFTKRPRVITGKSDSKYLIRNTIKPINNKQIDKITNLMRGPKKSFYRENLSRYSNLVLKEKISIFAYSLALCYFMSVFLWIQSFEKIWLSCATVIQSDFSYFFNNHIRIGIILARFICLLLTIFMNTLFIIKTRLVFGLRPYCENESNRRNEKNIELICEMNYNLTFENNNSSQTRVIDLHNKHFEYIKFYVIQALFYCLFILPCLVKEFISNIQKPDKDNNIWFENSTNSTLAFITSLQQDEQSNKTLLDYLEILAHSFKLIVFSSLSCHFKFYCYSRKYFKSNQTENFI